MAFLLENNYWAVCSPCHVTKHFLMTQGTGRTATMVKGGRSRLLCTIDILVAFLSGNKYLPLCSPSLLNMSLRNTQGMATLVGGRRPSL